MTLQLYDLDCVPLLRLEHAALKQVMARVRGVHERRRSRGHLAPQGRGGDDLVGGGGGDVGLQRDGAERADEPKPHLGSGWGEGEGAGEGAGAGAGVGEGEGEG